MAPLGWLSNQKDFKARWEEFPKNRQNTLIIEFTCFTIPHIV